MSTTAWPSWNCEGDRLAFGELGADQKRVLTRVTSDESSVLDGTVDLGAKQGDLILMNPSGFTVGPNAQFESVGALTLFTGSTVEFSGGSSVNLQTAADALPGRRRYDLSEVMQVQSTSSARRLAKRTCRSSVGM